MAYSTEQRDALKEAIASGATRVTYDGKTVEYRSLNDMEKILSKIEGELAGPSVTRVNRSLRVITSKGL